MTDHEWVPLLQQLTRRIADPEHRSHAIEKLLRKTPRWQDTPMKTCLAFCLRAAWMARVDVSRRRDRWGGLARTTRMPEQPMRDHLTPARMLELKEDLS